MVMLKESVTGVPEMRLCLLQWLLVSLRPYFILFRKGWAWRYFTVLPIIIMCIAVRTWNLSGQRKPFLGTMIIIWIRIKMPTGVWPNLGLTTYWGHVWFHLQIYKSKIQLAFDSRKRCPHVWIVQSITFFLLNGWMKQLKLLNRQWFKIMNIFD